MNFDLAEIRSQMQPGWSPVNIGLMIILFWIFWPLGLLMVGYILLGDQLGLNISKPETFKGFFARLKRGLQAGIQGFNDYPAQRSGTATPRPESRQDRDEFAQWREREQNSLREARNDLEREKRAFEQMKQNHSAQHKSEKESF